MKSLQRVTHENVGGTCLVRLYYNEGARVEETIEVIEGGLLIDIDLEGETISVELIDPGPDELEALVKVARERGLSLKGLLCL